MAAVTGDLNHILVDRIAAMIAAILRVTRDRTAACVVFTFIFVCHNLPLVDPNFATRGNSSIITEPYRVFNKISADRVKPPGMLY